MKHDLKSIEINADLLKSADFKYILKPALFFLAVAIGLITSLYIGVNQLKKIQSEISVAEKTQSDLTKKVQILGKIADLVPEGLDFINLALPHQNATIYALSQVKTAASKNGLIVSNLRSGAGNEDKGVTKLGLSFEVIGNESGVYAFLDQIGKSLPIMSIDRVKIASDVEGVNATVTVGVYSSALPKKIPSLTSPVSELTDAEVELLNDLAAYSQPTFAEVQPDAQNEREDPFN